MVFPNSNGDPEPDCQTGELREAWSPAARAASAAARRVKGRGGDWRTAATKVFINKGGAEKLPFGHWSGTAEGRGKLVTSHQPTKQASAEGRSPAGKLRRKAYDRKAGTVTTLSTGIQKGSAGARRIPQERITGTRKMRRADRARVSAYLSPLAKPRRRPR